MRNRVLSSLSFVLLLQTIAAGTSASQVHAWRRSLIAAANAVCINPHNANSIYAQLPTGQIGVSYNKGGRWTPLGSPGIAGVRQILVHPSDTSVIFAVAFSGGLRRSTDYGRSWSTVIPNYGIDGESVTFDFHRPDTMYAGNYADGRVYRSSDRGATWTPMGAAGSIMCALAHRPDSVNILYAGTGNGRLSKSTDFGATWRLVASVGTYEIPKIVIDPTNPLIAYGAAYSGPDSNIGVWKTTNGGELWKRTSLCGVSIWSLDISMTNPLVLYAGTFSDTTEAVYRTTDGGEAWDTLKTGFPSRGNSWCLKVDPFDETTVWHAINGGQTQPGIYRWVPLRARVQGVVRDRVSGMPATFGFVTLSSLPETLQLDQTGSYVFDYFEGDTALNPVAHVKAFPFQMHNEQLIFVPDSVISHDILLQRLPTGTISGTVRSSGTQQAVQARVELFGNSFGSPTILASATTHLNGEFQISGQFVSYPPIVAYDSLYVNPIFPFAQQIIRQVHVDTSGITYDVRVDTADVLVVSTSLLEGFLGHNRWQGYYREALDSLGYTSHVWNRNGRGYAPARRGLELRKKTAIYYGGTDSMSLSPSDRDSLIAGIHAGVNLFVTGQNFVELNDSLAGNYFGVRHGGNTVQTFVRGAAGELFATIVTGTNGGNGANNQTSRDMLRVDNPRARIPLTYGFGGGIGPAAVRLDSIGGGGKLVLFGFGFEALNSSSVRKTFMGQILGYFDGSIVLDVHELVGKTPTAFSLEQNFPNPFNPSTQIRYGIPAAARVKITVFDLLGREVAALVDETQQPGNHTVRWDASRQASGVYYCRLQALPPGVGPAGGFVDVKKLILLR